MIKNSVRRWPGCNLRENLEGGLEGDGMKRIQLLCLILTILSCPALAQAQQQCLHKDNERQADKERLNAVILAVRTLNTAEYRYRVENKRFATYDELLGSPALNLSMPRDADMKTVTFRPNMDIVQGFEIRVTTDGTKYNISVLDKTDPCRYSVFSSDVGIIYQGYPIQ
jgi:hypothetical protein